MNRDAKTATGHHEVVQMPDIYGDESDVEEATVEIVALEDPVPEDSEGFNPYDTANNLFRK